MIDARQHVVGKLIPYDFEQITIDATAGGKGLTTGKLTTDIKPKEVIITVEDAQIVYMLDGSTTVTADIGHVANPFDTIVLKGHAQLNNFKAIRKGSTSANISVTYFR